MINQGDIIEYFKIEFKSLMKRFGDKRQLNYSLDELNDQQLVECNWSQQHINISFKIIPIKYYLSNPAHRAIFKDNPENYRNYFIQVARHEYGHSISCESFNKLHSYKLSFNEFAKCTLNKQYFMIYLNEIYYDFIANYIVYEKIDNSVPEEHIKLNSNSFQMTFEAGYKIFDLIKICLLFSQVFYIYDQWEKLDPIFEEFNINIFLDILYAINEIFKKIIIKNSENDNMDIDSSISDIKELAAILDSINWKPIILENYSDKSNVTLLENFRNEF